MNLIDLSGKHVVITGASAGIGKASAILMSKLGAKVSLVARNELNLLNVMPELEGEMHSYFCEDLTDITAIEDLINKIVVKSGKIDGFVHSAGMELTVPLKVLKNEKLEEVFRLNVFAGFECAKQITKQKNCNPNASIIFISSIVGLLGQIGKIGYGASKGALVSGAKSMALELASRKIRVNTVLPALVETAMSQTVLNSISENAAMEILKMHPLGFGKPEDVANSIAFLLSDASSWITGTSFIVDGGYSAS